MSLLTRDFLDIEASRNDGLERIKVNSTARQRSQNKHWTERPCSEWLVLGPQIIGK